MNEKITLKEWIDLSPKQRVEIQEQWKESWNDWSYLLDEAIKDFKNTFAEIQEISDVQPAYDCEPVPPFYTVSRLISEPYIAVTTSLKNDEVIDKLPTEYAHFKVKQEVFGDTGQAYLEEWILILQNLLGWTEDRVIDWAYKHHADDLLGKNIMFNHELPCHYITDLLIPENKLILMSGLERSKILSKIEMAIYYQNKGPLNSGYDWVSACQRVNDVLKEVDTSLPE